MVEFAEKLEDNKVAEWRPYYIDYAKLKRLLDVATKGRDDSDLLQVQEDSPLLSGISGKEKKKQEFRAALFEERDRCRDFYLNELKALEHQLDVLVGSSFGTQARSRFSVLLNKRKSIRSVIAEKFHVEKGAVGGHLLDDEVGTGDESLHHVVREVASLKRALIDLHRKSQLLNNFAMLNYTGVARMVKKYNRVFEKDAVDLSELLEYPEQYKGTGADQLGRKMESMYAEWFCDRDLITARAEMVHKRGDGLEMDWSQLRLGYRLGMCFVLAVWITWDCLWNLRHSGEASIGGRTAFPVFRGCGGLLLVHWFWGCSTYLWRRFRINYIFLFDFNPRTVDEPTRIFNQCVEETLVYLILMLLYYKTVAHQMTEWMPPGLYPFFLVIGAAARLIFPLRTRAPMWVAIWKVVTAPFTSPIFFHTYVADVFTSMVKIFLDLLWTLCFILSGDFLLPGSLSNDPGLHHWQHSTWYKRILVPVLCFFPLWIRLMQCLRRYVDTGKRMPNLLNAFKYATAQTVTLFGIVYPIYLLNGSNKRFAALFQGFWLLLYVFSSLFSFFWDVYMDWGLGRREYNFLGPRLMYPSRPYYYSVIVSDLVLRFMWVQSLIPPSTGAYFEIPAYLTAINMSLELLRRTLWASLRMENEHRTNTQGYREEDFVPLHFTTQHEHNYKQDKKQVGRHVLTEVLTVTAIVVIVSMLVVITAQRSYDAVEDEL